MFSIKPLRLVPRLVLGGLVDRENSDKGTSPFIKAKGPFIRAQKPLGEPTAGTAFKAY
jgi:hypothetical protein